MKHEEKQYLRINDLAKGLSLGQDPYPSIVEVHPTDKCSHRCSYCFHEGQGHDASRIKDVLPLEKYDSLFRDMKELKIKDLSVSGGGEPTLDKRLPDLLRLASVHDLSTRFISHGNSISDELMDVIVSCEEVRFSIDAIKPETYSSIRKVPGAFLAKTIDNVQHLVKKRNDAHSGLKIGVTFLLNEINYLETGDFIDKFEAMGVDSIILKHDIYDEASISQKSLGDVIARVKNTRSSKLSFRDKVDISPNSRPCFTPYFKVAFNPYGELFSCCLGSQPGEKNGYLFGSLKTHSFKQIWEATFYIRKEMGKSVACVNCNYNDFLINQEVDRGIKNRA
jgi:MoaA/NifB/PqqE/SkfB family radical SAM enzyme